MPKPIPYPASLRDSTWKKNKTILAQETGIGKILRQLETAYSNIQWPLFNPKESTLRTPEGWAQHKKEAEAEYFKFESLQKILTSINTQAETLKAGWKKNTIKKIALADAIKTLDAMQSDSSRFAQDLKKFDWAADIKPPLPSRPGGKQQHSDLTIDIAKDVNERTKSKRIILRNTKASISFTIDDMGGKDNIYISAVIQDALSTAIQDTEDYLVQTIQNSEKLLDQITTDAKREQLKKRMEQLVSADLNALAKELDAIPSKKWKEYISRRAQYKDYTIKSVKKLVEGTIDIAKGGGEIASGGAAPDGVLTLIKGIVTTVGTLYDLAISIESAGKNFNLEIDVLWKIYNSTSLKAGAAIDTGTESINRLTEVFIGGKFLPSTARAAERLSLWDNKASGLHARAGDLGTLMTKYFNYRDKIPKTPAYSKIDKILDKIEAKFVHKCLETISSNGARFNKNIPLLEDADKQLKILLQINESNLPKIVRRIPDILGTCASLYDTWSEPVESVKDLFSNAKSTASDIKELHSAVKEISK